MQDKLDRGDSKHGENSSRFRCTQPTPHRSVRVYLYEHSMHPKPCQSSRHFSVASVDRAGAD
jgi:hypothetical protein